MPEDDSFVFDTNLGAKLRFLPGAHKHGVKTTDQLNVINEASVVFFLPATHGRSRREWLFLGRGLDGAILEVIALLGHREHFLVIHAMPMRRKWQARWDLAQDGERR
jgi:hypothetical protein